MLCWSSVWHRIFCLHFSLISGLNSIVKRSCIIISLYIASATYLHTNCHTIDHPSVVMQVLEGSRSFKIAPRILAWLKGRCVTTQGSSVSWKVAHIDRNIHHMGPSHGIHYCKSDICGWTILHQQFSYKHWKQRDGLWLIEPDNKLTIHFQSRWKCVKHCSMLLITQFLNLLSCC